MIRRRVAEHQEHCSNIPIDRNIPKPPLKEHYRPNKFNYQIEQV